MQVQIRPDVPDHCANVIDAALAAVSASIQWGEHDGRKRKPCRGQPLLLAGTPLGQYHCEDCGEMQMAGWPHLFPDDGYEEVMGRPWPAGYVGE